MRIMSGSAFFVTGSSNAAKGGLIRNTRLRSFKLPVDLHCRLTQKACLTVRLDIYLLLCRCEEVSFKTTIHYKTVK